MAAALPPRPSGPDGRNAALKLLGIGVLTLAMIVPLLLIASLVEERRQYAAEAAASVAQGWGNSQTIAGPMVVVPYVIPERRDSEGRIVAAAIRGEIVTLAKTLEAKASPTVEERRRGIFSIPVYVTDIELTGSFARPVLRGMPPETLFDWKNARLAVSVGDVRGIADVSLTWAGADGLAFDPGTGVTAMNPGVQTAVAFPTGDTAFTVKLRVRGTGRLAFIPAAESFSASISSAWPHPSFDGAYLPDSREIGEAGFNASWRVSHLARSLPQVWDNADTSVASYTSEFGVTFFQPVDFYHLVDRSLKYAILFVGLSFLAFFLIETVTGARVHVVQYLLAGAAQVIFYLLLLALAEQIGFGFAYLAAAIACVGLTTMYAGSFLGTRARAAALGGALTLLYGLLYTLLNEEDYALLTGAVASLAALALTMFLTRKVDWYRAQAALGDTALPKAN
jgi:inner membrane protein